jgi:hypothetical protein
VKAVHGDVHALLDAGTLQKNRDGLIAFPGCRKSSIRAANHTIAC